MTSERPFRLAPPTTSDPLGYGGVTGYAVGDLPGWTYGPPDLLAEAAGRCCEVPVLALTVGGLEREGRKQRRVVVAALPTWLDVALTVWNDGLQWAAESVCEGALRCLVLHAPVLAGVFHVGGHEALRLAVVGLAESQRER